MNIHYRIEWTYTIEDKFNIDAGKHVLAMCLNWELFWMNNKAINEFGFPRIWRIKQIEEGVIHRGWRPRWMAPSKICLILHILGKPNSLIALLFIQNNS